MNDVTKHLPGKSEPNLPSTYTQSAVIARFEKMEATLIQEFRKYAVPTGTGTDIMEISMHALAERLELVEQRLTKLEGKSGSGFPDSTL